MKKILNDLKKYKNIIIILLILIVILLIGIFLLVGRSIKLSLDKESLINYKLHSNVEASKKLVLDIPDSGRYDVIIKNPKVNISDYVFYSITDSNDKMLSKGIVHTDDDTNIKISNLNDLDEVFLNLTYLSPRKSTLEFDVTLSLIEQKAEKVATLIDGEKLNQKMVTMANNGVYPGNGFGLDENIESIKIAKSIDEKYKTTDNLVSDSSQSNPIYMWYLNHTIYFFFFLKIAFNELANDSFSNLAKLKDINDLKYFDTSKVKNMSGMFYGNKNLSDIKALAYFDTSNVEVMRRLFSTCTNLVDITPLYAFDTSNVIDISFIFDYAAIVDISPLEYFDVSKLESMDSAFYGTKITSVDSIKYWNASKLEDMTFAFANTFIEDVDGLSEWDTSMVNDMAGSFTGCFKLKDISGLKKWNTAKVKRFDYILKDTRIIDLDALTGFDTSSLESISEAFANIRTLKNINGIRNWNVSKVKSLKELFRDTGFSDLSPLEKWDVSNVVDMESTFAYTKIKNVDALKSWDVSKVKTFEACFYYSSVENLNGLKDWNLEMTENISQMFMLTKNLKNVDKINDWNISKVNNFHEMFKKSSGVYPNWNGTWRDDGGFVKNV